MGESIWGNKRVERWHVGIPAGGIAPGDGGVAFTAAELTGQAAGSRARLGLHEAMAAELPRAGLVRVLLPGYRGKPLVPVLSWLVTEHLATRDAEVSWYLEKQQGPGSCATLLTDLGWRDVVRQREGKRFRISGLPPTRAVLPEARHFSTVLGGRELTFLADYGVFSPDRIDDGTRLLADVALRQRPVRTVADIGVGYGALAIALVRNGVAERAVATDVDCLALWLAERNAGANGVPLTLRCTANPLDAEPTALTVCNVPTHIDSAQSAELMRALVKRAEGGRLLIVVHASLEARYTQHLAAAGRAAVRHPGPAHVVLETAG